MPYKSKAQEAYFNIHKKELEKKGVNVDEWNKESKGKDLPAKKGTTVSITVKSNKKGAGAPIADKAMKAAMEMKGKIVQAKMKKK
jgi:hypothetical protein